MRVRWLLGAAGAAGAFAQVAHATQYLTLEQAQRAAFPNADEFRAAGAVDAALATKLGALKDWAPRVFDARAGGKRLGWFIADQALGKSEMIGYALALDAHGAVTWLEILDYRESHGSEVRLAPWRKQFLAKTAQDPVELNRDIKNISGATLSCRHVTEGVQRLLKYYAAALAARPE
jgi:Na+-translocating ferredoxin:NAD+ oxidoreductase RnfG subunit